MYIFLGLVALVVGFIIFMKSQAVTISEGGGPDRKPPGVQPQPVKPVDDIGDRNK